MHVMYTRAATDTRSDGLIKINLSVLLLFASNTAQPEEQFQR